MWDRKELKARGKAAFKANYWRCVLAALILALLAGGTGAGVSMRTQQGLQEQQEQTLQQVQEAFDQMTPADRSITVKAVAGAVSSVLGVSLVLSILVFNPLTVGCQRFFRRNTEGPADLDELGYGFRNGYGRVVKTMLLTDVFLILWSLLFLIPGLVKSYSYRMVPFILSDEPELEGRAAIDRSREMMNGHKWRAFVLDLSFLLWAILSVITLGLVGVFYADPYYFATNAELYQALKGGSWAAAE